MYEILTKSIKIQPTYKHEEYAIKQTHKPNDPSAGPQTAFLEATWEKIGCHLGSIWELEAEEASGRHLESKSATPPKRNAKVPFNFQFY